MPDKFTRLKAILQDMGRCSVAVSGGVDSMTLASVAYQMLGKQATMVHARSASVPAAATERVQEHARQQGWNLQIIDAGEINNEDYRSNPVNRCYHCKTCLYSSIARLEGGTIVSGTNTDDLSDYRPGLIAASEQNVRHPFVEAEISKSELRQIARTLGLDDLAELPASPCLSSRVETGIPIQADDLDLIEKIEEQVKEQLSADNIRCRIRQHGIEIEIDEPVLQGLAQAVKDQLLAAAGKLQTNRTIILKPYRKGSAFIHAVEVA